MATARTPSIEARRSAARVVGGRGGCVRLEEHPQGRKLLGAVARAERLHEHVGAVLTIVSKGVGTATDLARVRAALRETDAMWLTLVGKRSLEHELVMRFLDAVGFAAGLEGSNDGRAEEAMALLDARMPEHRIPREAFVEAIDVWRGRKNWQALRLIVRYRVSRDVPSSPGALRVQYSRWRASMATTGGGRRPRARRS